MVVASAIVMIAMGGQPAAAQAPATFRHPGVLVNQAQLDFVKAQVNAGVDPWKTAFNAATSSTYASLTYTPHPWQTVECGPSSNPNLGCSDERNDALAAYTQALLWYITGNQTYAQNSVAIMNAWSSTLTGGHINSNAPLQAGWTGSVWPEAAEIIRASYSGWSASDISNFQNMLKTQYEPNLINGAPCKNGNWELIMTEAMMNISVFTDDSSLFNTAVGFWRGRVPAYEYLPSDGPTPVPPPNCGTSVTSYWNQTVFVDGLAQETSRDFGHTFWGLAASVNTAETAFQQGVDLYSENTQRIVDAFEFHTGINNGLAAPSGVNVGPTGGDGATMEICYNHFHNRMGISMPQTAQQIAAHRPTGANYFLAWETLTHAQVGWIGLQSDFTLSATPGSRTVTAGASTTYTATTSAVGGFTSAVTLTATGLPSGASASFSPSAINGSGSSTMNVTTSGSTPAGNYTLTITGTSGSLTHSATVTLIVNLPPTPDFTISTTQSSQSVIQGASTTYTANVSPLNGFTGAVGLTVSGLPSGATGTFNPTPVNNGSGSSTLTVTTAGSTPTGTVTLTITGTSGTLSHSITVMLTINTSCVTGSAGDGWHNTALPSAQTGTFTVTYDVTPSVSPLNAVVALSQGSQTAYTGFATLTRFNPSGAIDARNGANYAALSTIPFSGGVSYHFRLVINVSAHTYSIYVTPAGGTEQTVGTDYAFRTEQSGVTALDWWGLNVNSSNGGSLTACNFTVGTPPPPAPDFTLSANPSTQNITAGASASYTAGVSPLNGFTDSVSLSVSGLPTGASATFNPTSLTGSGSSTLSVSTTSSTPAGSYPLTITGTSTGGISHSASVTLGVSATGGTVVYHVNSGGPAVSPFTADANFSGGQTDTVTTTIDTSGVSNPAPMAVYQSERWGGDSASNPAPFSYTFPNLTAGASYTVRLHFAEIFWTAGGQRKFNVAINGTTVLTNFDIIAVAGAANKAIVEQFTTTANSSGQIVVSYTVGTADAPKSSGIEIIAN
jgi:hypothetical protein